MAETRRLYGYDYCSRLPCAVGTEKLPRNLTFDPAHADAWLSSHFRSGQERMEDLQAAAPVSGHVVAEALCVRALEVYAHVMSGANVPIFERGRVIAMAPSADNPQLLEATIALPVVDEFPAGPLFAAFRTCLQLTAQVLGRDPATADTAGALERINENLVRQLDQRTLFGTATGPICLLAFKAGVPFRHLGRGTMQLGLGASGHKQDNSACDGDSAIGLRLCQDKFMTAKVLRAAGLPAPEHELVASGEAAVAAAGRLGWPVVVKPFDQERSNGVTTGITDKQALETAVAKAQAFGKHFLVEKHAPGTCHRIMVTRGEIVYVISRSPKGVTGTGKLTIAELVAALNEDREKSPPWARSKPYPLDDIARELLASQGLTEDSVPEEGEYVALRSIPSEEWGGVVTDLSEEIHPDNVKLARAAADALGLVNAGIDLMTTDISRPWYENGAIINEMNFRPQFATAGRRIGTDDFIHALLPGKGRIPVHLVTGTGDVTAAASDLRRSLADSGKRCFLATDDTSEDAAGDAMPLRLDGVLERGVAMIMRPDVEELVIAGRWPGDFARGFPVDRFDTLHVISEDGEAAARIEREVRLRTNIGPPEQRQPGHAQPRQADVADIEG